MPEEVRQIGTEDAIQQVIQGLVASSCVVLDLRGDSLLHLS